MIAITLNPELDARLTAVSERTGRSKTFYVEAALAEYIEDLEDYASAEKALKSFDPTAVITLEEMRRELGLDR